MSTTATKKQPNRTSKRTGKGSKSSAKMKGATAKSKTVSTKTANKDGGKRLSPGALDGLVLGYMKRNRKKLPATPGVVGRGSNAPPAPSPTASNGRRRRAR
jgi:hypothetical protein